MLQYVAAGVEAVEHVVGVAVRVGHQVGRGRLHLGGQRPAVKIVHVHHSFKLHQSPCNLVQVQVRGRLERAQPVP